MRVVAGIMQAMASKGEKTRNDIIACAKNLFYQHGYEATSFSEIVSASGLFRGNIYHYFKSKDDILAAVIAQRRSDYRRLHWRSSGSREFPHERRVDSSEYHFMRLSC